MAKSGDTDGEESLKRLIFTNSDMSISFYLGYQTLVNNSAAFTWTRGTLFPKPDLPNADKVALGLASKVIVTGRYGRVSLLSLQLVDVGVITNGWVEGSRAREEDSCVQIRDYSTYCTCALQASLSSGTLHLQQGN